jgi:lethal(3)malignant brain tumor-like protein
MGSCPLSTSNLAKARSLRNKETKLKTIELDKEEKVVPKADEPEEEENCVPEEEEDELYVPQVRKRKKALEMPVRPTGNVRSDVHDSVFRPGYAPSERNLPVTKTTHAKLVNWGNVEGKFDLSLEGIKKWSSTDVSSFAEQVIVSKEKSQVFLDEVSFLYGRVECYFHETAFQNINGNAFLMLSQSDLVDLLGFKIGQAVKIYNSILLLKDGK